MAFPGRRDPGGSHFHKPYKQAPSSEIFGKKWGTSLNDWFNSRIRICFKGRRNFMKTKKLPDVEENVNRDGHKIIPSIFSCNFGLLCGFSNMNYAWVDRNTRFLS